MLRSALGGGRWWVFVGLVLTCATSAFPIRANAQTIAAQPSAPAMIREALQLAAVPATPNHVVGRVGSFTPKRRPNSLTAAQSAGVQVTNQPVHSKAWYFFVGAAAGAAALAVISAAHCEEPSPRRSCIEMGMFFGWALGGGIGVEVGEAVGAP
jgi:hypothetical protein